MFLLLSFVSVVVLLPSIDSLRIKFSYPREILTDRSFERQQLELFSRRSDFDSSSGVVKFVVSGLTDILKIFTEEDKLKNINDSLPNNSLKSTTVSNPVTLRERIIGDFDRGYLFTGEIDYDLYDETCTFTDPTISFSGLSTFKRNINAVRPLIDRFLLDREVKLFSCELNEDKEDIQKGNIAATWKMSGGIKLPWHPRIELTGDTMFSYQRKADSGKYLIVDYFERWDIPPSSALLQLITPGSVKL